MKMLKHPDFPNSNLFDGENMALPSQRTAISGSAVAILRTFGKMLGYAIIHGHAWPVWMPKYIMWYFLAIHYDLEEISIIPETTAFLRQLSESEDMTAVPFLQERLDVVGLTVVVSVSVFDKPHDT